MIPKNFQVTGGSTIGRDHREATRNNQDGYFVLQNEDMAIGVVTDGCSSGQFSEVGSRLACRLLTQRIKEALEREKCADLNWGELRSSLLFDISLLADSIGGDLRHTVEDYFLFTIVGVCLAYDQATFFAIGDGVVAVNGEITPLEPASGNRPAYIGYGLLPGRFVIDQQETEFQQVVNMPLADLDTFLIGTDGVKDLIRVEGQLRPGLATEVGELEQFWQQDRYFRNPELVSRELKVIGRDWPRRGDVKPGLLPDDTTLITGRYNPRTTLA